MRAIGPFLPNIPAAITQRTTGLAPALLAALVSIQLTGPNGILHLDVKVPAVILAALLSALRLPLIVCVVAGALAPRGLSPLTLYHGGMSLGQSLTLRVCLAIMKPTS